MGSLSLSLYYPLKRYPPIHHYFRRRHRQSDRLHTKVASAEMLNPTPPSRLLDNARAVSG